ncbi:chemotaxis-specific protein-glutamate methyltransferase CheB [uncultured Pseudokineococcus sp.]|uniref:chemotaxis-specific protein-glutamate methyltransferase CheB n=1 Tax=uncultured Pseudokineococcus sp. TaxID=1642928 RepID=UPI002602B1B1|nr:chemotaxis-specific protein-glutamate methyltransferase CheB [uncultured Pseudokineococcus sp.]
MAPIRVLVVDDAAVLRRLVARALTSAGGIDVVGTAGDGEQALEQVERLAPDLVVMDLEMPALDGVGAVRELRRRGWATPVVMVSTPTDDGAEATLRALAAGATDFFPKPSRASSPAEALARVRDGLVPVVRALAGHAAAVGPGRAPASSVHVGRPVVPPLAPAAARPPVVAPAPSAGPAGVVRPPVVHVAALHPPAVDAPAPARPVAPAAPAPAPLAASRPSASTGRGVPGEPAVPAPRPGSPARPPAPAAHAPARTAPVAAAPHPAASPLPAPAASSPSSPSPGRRGAGLPAVVAVGSSTGGPEALARLLQALPADLPVPVVVTQHMPPVFTRQLAVRLDRLGPLSVREAEDGDDLRPGRVLVAPGDRHLVLRRAGADVVVQLSQAAPVNFCRPAVDVMLRSCVDVHGAGVLAVVLTGMGSDGRDGCADVRRAGGAVLVQDAETSVVWGMPGAVASAGLADAVLPLDAVAGAVASACRRGAPAHAGGAR